MLTRRMFHYRLLDKELEDGGTGGDPQNEPESQNPTNSPAHQTGTESPFSSGPLAGKSPEEIATLVSTQQAAIREQHQALEEARRVRNEPAPSPKPEPTPGISSEDFWADPVGTNRRLIEDVVRNEMGEIIAPFKEDLATRYAQEAWNQLGQSYPDYQNYADLMRSILDRQGIASPNLQSLTAVYFMAKGIVSSQGSQDEPQSEPQQRVNSPQHRASSHPISDKPKKSENRRELTENERRLMRMSNMTEDEWFAHLEADEEEFMTMEVGGND